MPIIDADALKNHLSIVGGADDVAIGIAVNAANARVYDFCGRIFDPPAEEETTTRRFYPDTAYCCYVDDIASDEDIVVKTDAGQGTYPTTWDPDDYQLEPINGLINGQYYPWYRIVAVRSKTFSRQRRPSVEVTAAWGWQSIPAPVTQAALIEAARLFHRKDSPDGTLGFTETGVIRVSALPLDPNAAALLQPYRRDEVAVLIG